MELLADILLLALKNLFTEQPDILQNTAETTMTEWNLSHHYSYSLGKYLYWYDNDNDVTKRNLNKKRPDIIFHKRNSIENNYLVIEMKIDDEINENDIIKIKEEWFCGRLAYQYGSAISIKNNNHYKIVLIKNSNEELCACRDNNSNVDMHISNYNKTEIKSKFRFMMNSNIKIPEEEIEEELKKLFI